MLAQASERLSGTVCRDNVHLEPFEQARHRVEVPNVILHDQNLLSGQSVRIFGADRLCRGARRSLRRMALERNSCHLDFLAWQGQIQREGASHVWRALNRNLAAKDSGVFAADGQPALGELECVREEVLENLIEELTVRRHAGWSTWSDFD